MSFKVVADYDRCKSRAECMRIVPEVFEVRDDGYMYILVEDVDDTLRARCEEAVDACPTQALSIQA
jgi:ferredoxin